MRRSHEVKDFHKSVTVDVSAIDGDQVFAAHLPATPGEDESIILDDE